MARCKQEPLHTTPSKPSGSVLGGNDHCSVSSSPNSSWLCPWTDAMGTNSPSKRGASWNISVTTGQQRLVPPLKPAVRTESQHYSQEVRQAGRQASWQPLHPRNSPRARVSENQLPSPLPRGSPAIFCPPPSGLPACRSEEEAPPLAPLLPDQSMEWPTLSPQPRSMLAGHSGVKSFPVGGKEDLMGSYLDMCNDHLSVQAAYPCPIHQPPRS